MKSSIIKTLIKTFKKIASTQHNSEEIDDQFIEQVNHFFTRNGILDYNDLDSRTTPVAISADTPTDIPNDGEGPFSNQFFLPAEISKTWDVPTQRIDLTECELGTIVGYRIDMMITTTAVNQEVVIELELGLGVTPYILQVERNQYKAPGTYGITGSGFFYVGNLLTKDNPGRFMVTTDASLTLEDIGFATVILNR